MKVKHYFRFPIYYILYLIYQASGLIKRDKNIWVFGCHTGFGDNPRYLLINIKENHPEIRPIWISHNRKDVKTANRFGIECYYWLSLRGLYYSYKAAVYFCTRTSIDINRLTTNNALLVNLNHGIGLKKCYWLHDSSYETMYGQLIENLKNSFVFKVLTFPWLYRTPDVCLVTSDFQSEQFYKPMFNIGDENILFGNFPRNEMLLKNKDEIKSFAGKYAEKETLELIELCEKYDKVYIYMPTWRNDGSNFVEKSGIDFDKLNKILLQNKALLLFKPHPFTKLDLSAIEHYSNILLYNSKCETYCVLPFTDCLITDYSSIYTDYLLMNKEIILFPFDKDYYLTHCTELEGYENYYRGQQALNFNELFSLIQSQKDCHLTNEDHDYIFNLYWNRAFNGIDIVEEIKKRINFV